MDSTQEVAKRLQSEIDKRYKSNREFGVDIGRLSSKRKPMSEQNVSGLVNGKVNIGRILQERLAALGFDVAYIMTGRRADTDRDAKLIPGKRLIDFTVPTDATLFITETEVVEGGVRVQVFEAIREVKKIMPVLEDEGAVILRTPRAAEVNVPYRGKAAATPITNESEKSRNLE